MTRQPKHTLCMASGMSSLVETGGGYAEGTTNTYSARSVGDPKADTIKVLYNKSTGKVIAMHTLELTQLI